MNWRFLFANPWRLAPAIMPASPVSARHKSPGSRGLNRLLTSGSSGSGPDDKETVEVQRRRRTESTGPRRRADAPKRERDDGGSTPPSGGTGGTSGGYRPPSGSGGSPLGPLMGGGGRNPIIMLVLVLLLVVCGGGSMLLGGGGNDSGDSSNVAEQPLPPAVQEARPTARPKPTSAPRPVVTRPSTGAATGDTWTVMLYQDADDKILEQDIFVDLNEAERTGSTDKVQIVAQVDRFRGGFSGDGNWSGTGRFLVTQDDDLDRLGSQVVEDLGEVNMADGQTLVDFVKWAMENYPADKYALILSDHGMGWPGGWSDPDPGGSGDRSIPLAAALGNQLYLNELDDALAQIRQETGLDKFELIGMDACLMGHVEVLSALAPHANYAVLSQETEPALGWAYTSFLGALNDNPAMNGDGLATAIVDSYIEGDQRIVDPQARADFLGQGYGRMSASELTNQLAQRVTLTGIDLGATPELLNSLNELAYNLQGVKQKAVAGARNYAQSFTSIFGKEVPASYIDLGNFVQLLQQQTNSPEIVQAGDRVLAALSSAVVAEKHGPGKPGATGLSVYFPNSQLYSNPVAGAQSYTAVASRFAGESAWDDFLAFHYTGRKFQPADTIPVVPDRSSTVTAPGAGKILVSPITLSSDTAAPGQPVRLTVDVQGDNIGYIKFFTGFLDQEANSILVADMDFLESATTQEVDGVFYPAWPESGDFRVAFEWEPLVFELSDGQTSTSVLLRPEAYGATPEEAVYTVTGTYTYADNGDTRPAQLILQGGKVQQVFGYTGDGTTAAPREILPNPGDTFTVQQTWLDLDANGRVTKTATQDGDTLTFGADPFVWEELDAAAGEYVVGFMVQDLDGKSTDVYTKVTVE